MGIRGRLISLAFMAGMSILLTAIFGYYRTTLAFRETVEEKLLAKVSEESAGFEGWLLEKKRIAIDIAHVMEVSPDSLKGDVRYLNMSKYNDAVLNIAYADESGKFTSYLRRDFQNIDVHTRGWYKKLMQDKYPGFTNPYESLSIGDVAISAVAPVFKDGEFYGGVCVILGINSLLSKVGAMNYDGNGQGFLFDSGGHLIATTISTAGKSISEISALAPHEKEILYGGTLGISAVNNGTVVTFSRIPSTGWILVFEVSEQAVYAPFNRLRITYGLLSVFGLVMLLLMFRLSIKFADDIVLSVSAVKSRAIDIAKGNLAFAELPVIRNDELGELTVSFNTMQRDLRKLVGTTKDAAGGVSSSSKNLLEYAIQNAESMKEIANLASQVSASMTKQMEDVMQTAEHVDAAFSDMDDLSGRVKALEEDIISTADGSALILEDAKTILSDGGDEATLAQCFESLFEALKTLSQNSGELVSLVNTIEEKTGYIIDNINSMDIVSRNTAENAQTIETATDAQNAAVLDIVASAEAMDNLAKELYDSAARFKL